MELGIKLAHERLQYPERVTLKYSNKTKLRDFGATKFDLLHPNKKYDIIGMWKKSNQSTNDIKLTVSIDGDKDTNHLIIRRGADWETLKQNTQTVKAELDNIAVISKEQNMYRSTCITH